MKQLRKFQEFNIDAFLDQKKVIIGSLKPAGENDVKNGYDFILKAMILDDPANDGVNQGESLSIKLKKAPQLKVGETLTFGDIHLKNSHAVVFGDYSNQLSIKAESFVKSRE